MTSWAKGKGPGRDSCDESTTVLALKKCDDGEGGEGVSRIVNHFVMSYMQNTKIDFKEASVS